MSEFVADATAIVAFARGEKGESQVAAVLHGCLVSSVNLTEAYSRLVRYGTAKEEVEGFLREFFPVVVPQDRQQAELSAVIHVENRRLDLSYADCACLALGVVRKATVLTADRIWKDASLDVKLKFIR